MALRPVDKSWNPNSWASLRPFGIGLQKPNNFLEIFRAISENADSLEYAFRILNDGVCDGCALGTSGLKDWTIKGVHLCNIRLRLLRLNTMGPLDGQLLEDVSALEQKSSAELRGLGRLPYPMRRKKGDKGFSRISWDEALDRIGLRVCKTHPNKMGFYLTSRGIPNETYYVAQKAIRALGSNNIDNAARICHSPSTVALKEAIGAAATTCSYTDLIGTDLVVFFGSNPAVNQPVMMKYLYYAKKAGTQIVCVNPYLEPAMQKYWIPSDPESAVFGTKITDRFFQVEPGGDSAFIAGVLKHLLEQNWVNAKFIQAHTQGFEALSADAKSRSWEELENASGSSKLEMLELAQMLAKADKAVLVWSMGITQHTYGEDTVQSIINLGLARGYLGREGCGLMPIRGHSGVQGGAEMGAYATVFPGVVPINPESADGFSHAWGFKVPDTPGLSVSEMLEGNLEILWSMGGNFLETLPNPSQAAKQLASVPLRVHQDIVLTSQMLVEPAEEVILLPATTRYEIPGGCTETSTERRVIFSPEIPGKRIPEARWEGAVFAEVVGRTCNPDLAAKVRFESTEAVRAEIAQMVPLYNGIQNLKAKGDAFQYGGPHLCPDGVCPTPDGRANFKPVPLPSRFLPEGAFRLVTRRGKQFNSMVHENTDPINGAPRDAVFISTEDAARLQLRPAQTVWLQSQHGSFRGQVFIAPIQKMSLQVHWPEGNVLLDPHLRSVKAKIPAYKEVYVYLSTQEPQSQNTNLVAQG